MESFLAPQIEYLLILQNFRQLSGGVLDNFFMFITSCGEITIPVILTAGIYWCINSKYGLYIFWNWCVGMIACQFLKSLACIYRPWVLDTRIQPIPEAFRMSGGYSFPSGHTQTAVAIWGSMAVVFKNKLFRAAMILLILLIAFSRNYVGVHTPQDVITSLVLGCVMLFLISKLMKWVENGKNRDIILLSAVYLSAVLLIGYEHFKSYPMDYIGGNLLVDPQKMVLYSFPKIGLYLGIFTGWFITNRWVKFDGSVGTKLEKVIRFIVGATILTLISTQSTTIFSTVVSKRTTMFLTSFLSSLFVLTIYPWLVIMFRKFVSKREN